METKWRLRTSKEDLAALSKSFGVSRGIAAVMVNRGVKEIENISKYLFGDLGDLYDPFLMQDMHLGTRLLYEAVKNNKNIVVYGDYDADGITSTFILYSLIKECGGNVSYYIPLREEEGYGMNLDRIEALKNQGAEFILTCDNGISAVNEINRCKELGITVVITDHHELTFIENEDGERKYIIPSADAVINPKRRDCTYPFKGLCGAGIAFKFAQAFFTTIGEPASKALKYLEYAGIGTVCDIVDLVDENRIIVKHALEMISDSKNLGICMLKKILGIENKAINTYNIGFQLGPCLNATGRLDKAALSVELLLLKDEKEAENLAYKLNELNKQRQDLTRKSVDEMIQMIESGPEKNDRVLVLYNENVHESIAGIAAGKIKEKYYLPTLVLTKGKEGAKGSGRSIEGYNMFEELLKCKNFLGKFGGHPMAAGLSIKEENIPKLRAMLNHNCTLTENDISPKIFIDYPIALKDVNEKLIKDVNRLEPFGKGNDSPLFAAKKVKVLNYAFLGNEQKVLRLRFDMGDGRRSIDGVSFSKSEEFRKILENFDEKNLFMDIIYFPYLNIYKDYKNIQLKLKDFRVSS